MSILQFLLIYLAFILRANSLVNINVGLLMPNGYALLDNDVGFKTSAGAIIVALRKAIENGIYNPNLYNITFSWNYHIKCDESLAVGYASEMINKKNVSVIFGPVCIESAEIVGALGAYTKTPIFLWTTVGNNFRNKLKYPTVVAAGGTVRGLVSATSNLIKNFNWTEAGFLYTDVDSNDAEHTPFCKYFNAHLQNFLNGDTRNISFYSRFANNDSVAGFQTILLSMKTRSRIILACLENRQDQRNFMMAATLNKMVGRDYVYIFIQNSASGFGDVPFWEPSDKWTATLKEAAKSVLILDKYAEETQIKDQIDRQIIEAVKGWPFYEKNVPSNAKASNLAFYLGDAFSIYLQCLNWTYTKYGESGLKNTSAILERLNDRTNFSSINGNNFTFMNSVRYPRYALYGLDITSKPTRFATVYGSIKDIGVLYTPNYESEEDSIWAIRGGKRPLSRPICGFDDNCRLSPIFVIGISVASILLFVSIVLSLVFLIYICQKQEQKRLNQLWQIRFSNLIKPDHTNRSSRSLQSASSRNSQNNLKNESKCKEYFYLENEIIVSHKHPYYGGWSSSEEEEFRKMRTLDHEKLNRFLGVSISQNTAYFLWGYCDRGNIIEVIKLHSFRFDSTIMLGMMMEIVEGLHYIHNSTFGQHGSLSAYNCVIGDRFNVRIQDYGCSAIKCRSFRSYNSKSALYVAPEHLQGKQNEIGSKAGDIYSFAIISSVIITMKPAFGIEDVNNADLIEETIRKVKADRYPAFRPSLNTNTEIHSEIFALIKDCWSEVASERPAINEIREMLSKRFRHDKYTNLMDHMFSLMENSAAELENDVKMRTLELKNEQKKADILLYRIMPKAAADKLKIGEIVPPEVFEQATVLFADIVSFTVLASKSTPLQIINFLNDLYTIADSVIDKHDVYKVETIGDGMHVVSGIPNRNGNNHVSEIINMAIDFQRAVKTLRLSHLPNQQIQMRIGVHSGSCVAGIVGVTNPRYIVFGDTVNMSAKMETSGRAGRIHITKETRDLLLTNFSGNYKMEERGETLIKGIGAKYTYWINF